MDVSLIGNVFSELRQFVTNQSLISTPIHVAYVVSIRDSLTAIADATGKLKIRWANTPCGFDPRHRHQTVQIRTQGLLAKGSDFFFIHERRARLFQSGSTMVQQVIRLRRR